MQAQWVQELVSRVVGNVDQVVVGKRREVEMVMIALLCGGHVLIEDVPGVGKTVLAKAVARSIGASFKRLQFTPDLLPGDVTGVSVFDPQKVQFEFRPGPLFAQLVLADEINRATPKTQSALLEAMEEGQVTVDGVTHRLPEPFTVLATENPIDYEGTFPLPEAQLDRFLVRISLGYPGRAGEVEMLQRQHRVHPLERIGQVINGSDLVQAQGMVREIAVDPAIANYIVSLVEASRASSDVQLGASPRGSLALYNASRALAALSGRDYVIPDDVKALAVATLAHRLIISPTARVRGVDSRVIIQEIVRTAAVPGARPAPVDSRSR
ncbi:MAG TPA: MoxR family ATPase [Thermomicrobiales bacterium]|nr:MoxR family ATPase [Thermomicrobiales bacterium]HRA46624.1 MoxR family ATPase [Thermomicrobiales bacterium]